jgi:hypothetical protein
MITFDTVPMTWNRGFPSRSGLYLVELTDGEHCVTPYNIPGQEGEDTWGDKRRPGWCCLIESRATVYAWAEIPKARR